MPVEKFAEKRGPISFEDMYELIKNRPEAFRGDEQWKLWGYSEEVEDTTVRKRTSDFNKWLEQEHGLIWQSTTNYRLYPADEVRDYRRKPK
jgi:hypothetical protein